MCYYDRQGWYIMWYKRTVAFSNGQDNTTHISLFDWFYIDFSTNTSNYCEYLHKNFK